MLGANHLRDAASMGMMRIRPPVYRNDMAIDVAGIVRREKGDGSSGIFRRAWERRKTVQLNMCELLGGQHSFGGGCQQKPGEDRVTADHAHSILGRNITGKATNSPLGRYISGAETESE